VVYRVHILLLDQRPDQFQDLIWHG
jgi:hypothetical protein